nr:hypothetical protein [Thermosporothrix hazakensis]
MEDERRECNHTTKAMSAGSTMGAFMVFSFCLNAPLDQQYCFVYSSLQPVTAIALCSQA